MDNLQIYNVVRKVPENAQKTIGGGRLKGMTDINPMWRFKILTEQFGPCGIGWKYEIMRQWTEQTTPKEISAFVTINLYIKYNGEWSEAIPGTGGSSFLTEEKNGLYTNDECYKMALTDAVSVSCKALGVAADIYWDKDNTKYNDGKKGKAPDAIYCADCGKEVLDIKKQDGTIIPAQEVRKIGLETFGRVLCSTCMKKSKQDKAAEGEMAAINTNEPIRDQSGHIIGSGGESA